MPKIAFVGAGSSVFAKNILGDVMCTPALNDSHIALYDIDAGRLEESRRMLEAINRNINQGRAKITAYLGPAQRKAALKGAKYVVNAIQVGGYKPSTVIDFEIPKKYGLRQTIGDTLGIGGIFRALRTIPVMLDIARDMEAVCPDAWLLNYTNPMAMLTAAMLRGTPIRTVGLCHSVQGCARRLAAARWGCSMRWSTCSGRSLASTTRRGCWRSPTAGTTCIPRSSAGRPSCWRRRASAAVPSTGTWCGTT